MFELPSPDKKSAPLNHTKNLGTVEFSGYLKSHPETVQLIFSVQKYLQSYPRFYFHAFLSSLKGQAFQLVKKALEDEYKALVEGRSFLHVISNAIQARKKCINKIRRDISKSIKFLAFFTKEYHGETLEDAAYIDWVEMQGYSVVDVDETIEQSIKVISNIFVDMSRLRDMTMYIVEEIHRWRVRVEQHLDRCQQHSEIKFIYQEEPIYQTMLKDITFIWNSKLSQYIWLQVKQDPFLIRNVILVDQRQPKTLLQKYFVQVLYPKNDKIVDKALQCFEMLAFKYRPRLYHRYEEEQLLIQNYLKMEMNEHQFDESEPRQKSNYIQQTSSPAKEIKRMSLQQNQQSPQKQKNQLRARGWIFEKQLKKSTRERISQIVETHKNKKGLIQPFNIANYSQKNSIALAYLSQAKTHNKRQPRIKINSAFSDAESKKFFSQGEDNATKNKEVQKNLRKGLESQPERTVQRGMSESKMFRSLTRLNQVILQDPKEHLPDTPKASQKQANDQKQYKTAIQLHPSLHNVKINSFAFQEEQDKQVKIQVQEQQTPLNLTKFYQIFRADTNKFKKLKESIVKTRLKQQNKIQQKPSEQKERSQKEKLISFKQLLDKSRKQRAQRFRSLTHLPYVKKSFAVSLAKKKNQKDKSREKTIQKSNDSYKQYSKVKPQIKQLGSQNIDIKKTFLALQAKTIPLDLVAAYVKHLQTKRPIKSKIFSSFNINALVSKLTDPYIHSIIFDIHTEHKVSVGTIILSENLGGRAGKLKYMVEYMSIHPFEFVSIAMLRVAQQLLSATPCQQVVYTLHVDRLDIVSSQFIEIIDNDLASGVQKFGQFMILQKPYPQLKDADVRERVYVFTSPINMKKQYEIGLKMMGNYRSLKFDCKCIVLTSNFRLRSEKLFKDTQNKYQLISIGQLYALALTKIMNKYHLKQLNSASYGGEGELGQFVRKDPFLRATMNAALRDLKEGNETLLKTTAFGTMEDLINYFRYKNLDYKFQLQFLSQSRFILRHELILVELDQQLSLQFTLTSNKQLYILHNYKNNQITKINCSKIDIPAYLLPTTNQKVKLFVMSGAHYVEQTTDQLDLYSYLSFFFKNIHSQVFLNDIPSIVIPNLKKFSAKLHKVRMYDGFFKLFPERQFYSAAMLSCSNYWQSYYADAVTHSPVESSIVLDYPFLIGFYDTKGKNLLTAFLYNGQSEKVV